jgi:hypothetical protein
LVRTTLPPALSAAARTPCGSISKAEVDKGMQTIAAKSNSAEGIEKRSIFDSFANN